MGRISSKYIKFKARQHIAIYAAIRYLDQSRVNSPKNVCLTYAKDALRCGFRNIRHNISIIKCVY